VKDKAAGAQKYTQEVVSNVKTTADQLVEKVKTAWIGKKEEAPEFLLDNEYIERGYRIEHTSVYESILSLFTCHNESVNVWSHLVGSMMFLAGFCIFCCMIVPQRFRVG